MVNEKTVILILTHGKLAQTLVDTMKLIIGKSDDVYYINFPKEAHIDYLENEVESFIKNHANDNIIIFVDILGGSCFNIASKYTNNDKIHIFCGVNLPLLLETAMSKNHLTFTDLIDKIDKKLNTFIIDVNNTVNSKGSK